MATKRENELKRVAGMLNVLLHDIYGCEMGFILLVSTQNTTETVADFVGNSRREDSIAWMKETIERFEADEIMPTTEGSA